MQRGGHGAALVTDVHVGTKIESAVQQPLRRTTEERKIDAWTRARAMGRGLYVRRTMLQFGATMSVMSATRVVLATKPPWILLPGFIALSFLGGLLLGRLNWYLGERKYRRYLAEHGENALVPEHEEG